MEWHFDDNMPIYTQLVYQIKFAIVSGELSPGERMAGVRDLAADAGVNPNTMQRALAAMESEELMYSNRTKGRFVTENHERVAQIRRELAEQVLQEFIAQMKELQFTATEAVVQVEQNWEVQHESH